MKQVDKKEIKSELPQYVIFAPSDYDIVLKVVPSKEFFEKKMSDQEALEGFNIDEKRKLMDTVQNEIEVKYAERLDTLACRLPDDLLKNLATTYMDIRKLKGKIKISEGLVQIIDSKGRSLSLRLDHMLTIICSAPSSKSKKFFEEELKKLANYYKKVDKTSKIEANIRKGF